MISLLNWNAPFLFFLSYAISDGRVNALVTVSYPALYKFI